MEGKKEGGKAGRRRLSTGSHVTCVRETHSVCKRMPFRKTQLIARSGRKNAVSRKAFDRAPARPKSASVAVHSALSSTLAGFTSLFRADATSTSARVPSTGAFFCHKWKV